ncbi:MAG: hypothetical protein WC124_02045 [Desulfoplanes sp.]
MAKTVRQGVTANMDKIRTLRFTARARSIFEDLALVELGMRKDANFNILQIITMYWGRSKIQTFAVMAALSHEEALSEDQANDLIDAYTDRGTTLDDLGIAIQEACRMAYDPSSLAFWKKSLENLKSLEKIRKKEAEAKLEKQMAEVEEKTRNLTLTPEPTDSESSD